MYEWCRYHYLWLSTTFLLILLLCSGRIQAASFTDGHSTRNLLRHHPSHATSTFLYGVTNAAGRDNGKTLSQTIADENKLNIAVFKLRRNGMFTIIPLRYNSKASDTGYAGTVNGLTAAPDGRFLVMECNNTDDGNYRPIFLQYRIRPDGQLTPYERFSLATGARNIVFAPSGRYAYASVPDLSGSQSLPGKVLEFHVSAQGSIIYPPFASVPCGPMPTTLTLDASGRVAGIMDAETGFLWQYIVTAQGHLVPMTPPSVAVAKAVTASVITKDGQLLYIASNGSRGRNRIYQLRRRANGGFSLLMPWAVRLPGVVWSVALSNKYRVVYISLADRLLTFQIGPQGILRPSRSSIRTVVGVTLAVDEYADCLYVQGLHNLLHAYRIHEGGALEALGPAAAGYRMTSLTVIHR